MGRISLARVVVLGVGDDAHNLEGAGILLVEDAEVAADWIFFGKELLHECLVDDGHFLRRRGVLLGEAASAENRLAHGLKEVRAYAVPG